MARRKNGMTLVRISNGSLFLKDSAFAGSFYFFRHIHKAASQLSIFGTIARFQMNQALYLIVLNT